MKTTKQPETTETPDRVERQEYVQPDVNIIEEKEGYTLEAEMPGVGKEGLEVLLEANELTILGHRQRQVVSGQPIFRESHNADYRRVFELDPAIDTTRIVARMNQGLLTLTLPKSEQVKPRRIVVSS